MRNFDHGERTSPPTPQSCKTRKKNSDLKFKNILEYIVEIDPEKFFPVVLEVLGDGEGCYVIYRRQAVNFIRVPYKYQHLNLRNPTVVYIPPLPPPPQRSQQHIFHFTFPIL